MTIDFKPPKPGGVRTEDYGGSQMLCCPACGNGYIHHEDVLVFSRRTEDAPSQLTRVVAGGMAMVGDSGQGRNPSSRRDGIAIRFWCEGCGADDFELTIEQHKGNTFVGWRDGPPSCGLTGEGRRRP